MSFTQLGLSLELIDAVTLQGYTTPTPIQKMAIPILLKGHDILAGAQTGTGKTAAFVLPLLQTLTTQGNPGKRPLALILTPTRELAAQVRASVQTYGKNTPLRSTTIIGGADFPRQEAELRKGIHIIVATPGRLIDHLSQETVDLSHIQFLVLDEADQMLDQGFLPTATRIVQTCPPNPQMVLFSATISPFVQKLITKLFSSVQVIQSEGSHRLVPTLTTKNEFVIKGKRFPLLEKILSKEVQGGTLIFTNTRKQCDQLAVDTI